MYQPFRPSTTPRLTNGVFPTAPVKPSTVPEVNDLQRCDREFGIRNVLAETSIVVASIQDGCALGAAVWRRSID